MGRKSFVDLERDRAGHGGRVEDLYADVLDHSVYPHFRHGSDSHLTVRLS